MHKQPAFRGLKTPDTTWTISANVNNYEGTKFKMFGKQEYILLCTNFACLCHSKSSDSSGKYKKEFKAENQLDDTCLLKLQDAK